jgi:hypothetical protein
MKIKALDDPVYPHTSFFYFSDLYSVYLFFYSAVFSYYNFLIIVIIFWYSDNVCCASKIQLAKQAMHKYEYIGLLKNNNHRRWKYNRMLFGMNAQLVCVSYYYK